MYYKKILLSFLFFSYLTMLWCQGSFEFLGNRTSDRVNFKLINNLILVPVLVNDVPLTFLLDTGASSTVIFSFEEIDEIELYNNTVIKLRGLGKDEPIDALMSEGNTVKIGNSKNTNQTIYVVFDGALNFSARLGYPVHGILGNDFMKSFVLEVNNVRERMRFFLPEHYRQQRCRNCIKKDIIIHKDKPYLTAHYKKGEVEMDVHLLIDSGSGDGLWLFENSDDAIVIPENSFDDYLGLGINGNIYGKRSKIEKFSIGDFELENVNTSYPDIDFLDELEGIGARNGSLGGEILKRFNWTIDYSNKTLLLKKNRYFREPFHYNMSGLTLEQGGFVLAPESNRQRTNPFAGNQNELGESTYSINLTPKARLELHQLFEVVEVRENSPAYLAGVRSGDEILEINNKRAYHYSLNEINQLFLSKEGRTIRMKILRNGIERQVRFDLRDLL